MVLELKRPLGAEFTALKPLLPVFLSYVMSFVYVGIYWNNHHHLLHSTKEVSAGILWANLHLLFWLSLFPFATAWMGENHLASAPTATYGFVLLMAAIAFFGKGVAALGWAVMSDAAPREATGLSGSIFNLFGNAAGIFTPIGIGYILAATDNNWNMALLFVFAHSIVAMVSYLFITGTIKRVVLKTA